MTSQGQWEVRKRAKLRRARIRHAALTKAPLRLTGGWLARLPAITRLATVRRVIALPHLPRELDGLRIAHLSDLHIGELIQPHRLPGIVDAANALRPDMVAVTGDFIDLKLDVLDEVARELRRLVAPLGVFLVAGNHDHLVDGDAVVKCLRTAGLDVLMNEHRRAVFRGRAVTIGGIDYAHREQRLKRFVARSFRGAGARGGWEDLRVLLAHHPHAFEAARQHGVDVTLSGHTHGGQVVLWRRRSKKGSIGLGNLGFRYPKGLYRCGHQYLHVTSGIGSWFPLRVKCPAEVACLTLRRAG